MKVVNVRINGMENPVGFDFETVCVSWKVRETSARRQQNVKIEIALTEDFSELLWTKEGKNLNSAAEKLEFEQSAYTRYYVRVTVPSVFCFCILGFHAETCICIHYIQPCFHSDLYSHQRAIFRTERADDTGSI